MTDHTNASATVPVSSTFRPEMAFPFLTDEMLVRLASYGHEVVCAAGTALWTAVNARWTCSLFFKA